MSIKSSQILYVTALSGSTATLQKARTWGPLPQARLVAARADYEIVQMVLTTTNAVAGNDVFNCPGFVQVKLERVT